MAPTTDEKLDALLAAVGGLTTAVGELVGQIGAQPTAAAAPPSPAPTFELTQDDGYSALVEMDDSNIVRRTQLAADLGILGTEPGAELVKHGARGFYRRLMRDEGQDRLEFRRDHARRLVEDALLEDVKEANDMGADLLKVWDADEAETFAERGAPDVLAGATGIVESNR